MKVTGTREINVYLMYKAFSNVLLSVNKIVVWKTLKFSTPMGENLHPHTFSNSSMCMPFQRNTLFELKRTKNILLRSL